MASRFWWGLTMQAYSLSVMAGEDLLWTCQDFLIFWWMERVVKAVSVPMSYFTFTSFVLTTKESSGIRGLFRGSNSQPGEISTGVSLKQIQPLKLCGFLKTAAWSFSQGEKVPFTLNLSSQFDHLIPCRDKLPVIFNFFWVHCGITMDQLHTPNKVLDAIRLDSLVL